MVGTMTPQKIQDKQEAILKAAVKVFSERGFWNTPTSLVSKTAGIADGTLFTYFKTKDDLITEVYLDLKRDLARSLLEGLPEPGSTRDKLRHLWAGYIEWGIAHPDEHKVLYQIGTSYKLDVVVKAQANEPFIEIERLTQESIARGEMRDYPVDYLATLVDSHANMTIAFMTANPGSSVDYISIGFDILWNGITR
jgi:AcrR family transcriptional regulator